MSRPAARRDGGFSLVELSIVIMLFGILGAVTTTMIVEGFKKQAQNDGRSAAIVDTRTALQRAMRDIRGADRIDGMSTNALTLESSTATGATKLVEFFVTTSGGISSLTERTTINGQPAAQRTVVSHLVNANDTANPVFASGGVARASYTPPAGGAPVTTCLVPGGSSYEQQCLATIVVRLVVDPVDAVTGRSLCTGQPSTCEIDVNDSADLRNLA